MENAWITDRQIEASRVAITASSSAGQAVDPHFPDKPYTKSPRNPHG